MKDMTINIQEAQWTPGKVNSKRPTPRHIIQIAKRQRKNFDVSKTEGIHHIQETLNKIISRFLTGNLRDQKAVSWYSQNSDSKNIANQEFDM